ncbi:unnamed protein product [Tuber aestivum]|uniref:Transcription elongation factor n=1 Tax=Tuber aestivum TaxID=59557 RepID=A0A292PV58_9PEZI|nr:unnamed protein product [Tuber aestivum]
MDAKEVKTHVTNIEKAVKEKLPPAVLIDILNSLKTGVTATEQLLRDTKVGMAVNKLRMNGDRSVSDLAKEIVAKWKKDVHTKTKPSGSSSHDGKKERMVTVSPSRTPPKPSGKRPADLATRSRKTDNVNWQCTGEATRDNCLGIIYDALALGCDASSEALLSLAKSIESITFTNYKKTDAAYKRRMQVLFLNLKSKDNNLRNRVVSGEITPTRLSTMESSEMASAQRRQADEKLMEENMRTAMMAKSEKSISDQLTCGKCGQKKVSYTQAQTRSADEPMTTFCTCEICSHRWKFS